MGPYSSQHSSAKRVMWSIFNYLITTALIATATGLYVHAVLCGSFVKGAFPAVGYSHLRERTARCCLKTSFKTHCHACVPHCVFSVRGELAQVC